MMTTFLALLFGIINVIYGSYDTCEDRDGDCNACPNITFSVNGTFTAQLSQNKELVTSAQSMDKIINATDSTDIIKFDNPQTSLHMSIAYTCCHSSVEFEKMLELLPSFKWTSIELNFTRFGCNIDTHNNHTVYLHALPDEYGENQLFELVGELYEYWTLNGIPINHPRQSLFHMTLAYVTRQYPTDQVVNQYESYYFGTHRLCKFGTGAINTVATDCS